MLICLPFLAFVILAAGFRRRRAGWRESLLFASIPWALFLTFITEALTPARLVTWSAVAWIWLGFCLLCLAWMLATKLHPGQKGNAPLEIPTAKSTPLAWDDRLALILVAATAGLAALTAVVSAPNTWDAMRYHLPRVIEWIVDRGVQFFPTPDRFQLDQPPFAEYAMLHVILLSGSDRFTALIPWFSYAGCILGVSLIAKELGGGKRAQIVTAVFAATVPTAVLEASGTKNECVAAYWIVLATYFLLRWRNVRSWPCALAIGASFGLAVFTKGTSYAFLPCIFLACAWMWNGTARKRFLFRLPAIAAIGVLVCAPFWFRNYRYTGSVLGLPYVDGPGPVAGRMLENARITPGTILANMVRNVSLHVGIPSERVNAFSTRAFSDVIRAIGEDPDDYGQIDQSSIHHRKFSVWFDPRYEVLAGDPLPVLLFLIAGVLFLLFRRRMSGAWGWLALGLIAGFVLFSALIRWSPWNARYQLPLLLIAAAFTALVLVRIMPRWAVTSWMGLALAISLLLALTNETRPLLTRHGLGGSILTTSRDKTYFFDFHEKFSRPFIAAAAAARSSRCRSIGLDADVLHYEYPVMAMIEDRKFSRHIRYVGVDNSSVKFAHVSDPPVCIVICFDCLHDHVKMAEYSKVFANIQSFGNQVLFSEPVSTAKQVFAAGSGSIPVPPVAVTHR